MTNTTGRIITSRDVKGGTVYGESYKKIRHQNDNPVFTTEKSYTFIKLIKTTTEVHGWLFVFNDKFYIATYNVYNNCTSQISIYDANKHADFDCQKPIENYNLYCDIETVVDMFCAKKLSEGDIN